PAFSAIAVARRRELPASVVACAASAIALPPPLSPTIPRLIRIVTSVPSAAMTPPAPLKNVVHDHFLPGTGGTSLPSGRPLSSGPDYLRSPGPAQGALRPGIAMARARI